MAKYKQSLEQWEVVAPKLKKIVTTYRKDEILVGVVETILNRFDSLIINGEPISELIKPLMEILGSDYYYVNMHKYSSDAEKEYLKSIFEDIELLYKLVAVEENIAIPVDNVQKARIPNGENTTSVFDKSANAKGRIV